MLRNNTDAHISSLGYLCLSIKISISLGKTFLRISRIRNIPLTWILARVFVYLPPFISQILDFIYWTVLILILIYCEWRDTENHGLERRSAGSFPEQRPFVIPIESILDKEAADVVDSRGDGSGLTCVCLYVLIVMSSLSSSSLPLPSSPSTFTSSSTSSASSTSSPSLSDDEETCGYDFEFVEELKDEYKCPVCLVAMKNPVQTKRCGHRYCRECLLKTFRYYYRFYVASLWF